MIRDHDIISNIIVSEEGLNDGREGWKDIRKEGRKKEEKHHRRRRRTADDDNDTAVAARLGLE